MTRTVWERWGYSPAVIFSVEADILAVRSSLSQLKGLPSMARFTVFREHDREDLAVGEALDPNVEEEPEVALAGGVFAFECESEGEEAMKSIIRKLRKKANQLVEARGRG